MRKIFLLIALLLFASPVLAQTMKRGGGEVSINRDGAVTVKSRSDKLVAITGPTVITGATTITGATGITGNTAITGTVTVSSTLAVTGATTLTGGVTIGTGNALTKLAKYTATLTPAEVAANTCAEQLFTVTGLTSSDILFVNKPTAQAGLGVAGVRASATNQAGINFCNTTAAPITPTASEVYSFGAIR